jgi:hypothetical protein
MTGERKAQMIIFISSKLFFISSFHANVRLDYSEQKIVLHPQDQRKEDFVQTELRRLKENLHSESLKMRRPPQLSYFFFPANLNY